MPHFGQRFRSPLVSPRGELPPHIPAIARRHASPAGPWPWQDLDYEQKSASCSSLGPPLDDTAHFFIPQLDVRSIDVGEDGGFSDVSKYTVSDGNKQEQALLMRQQRPAHTRVRALFMDHLSVSVMQILGTKYNIEPFYFSSSVNWIPSCYQEAVHPKEGDHITITLTFVRGKQMGRLSSGPSATFYGERIGDQPALILRNDDPSRTHDQSLVLEMLALHMVRTRESSTIISYHAPHSTTSAEQLHNRVALAGRSVYWKNIFEKSKDPTIVLLTTLWFAIYAWDESLGMLSNYVGQLEISVFRTHDVAFTQELHKVQAHLLSYEPFLDDFSNAVLFLRNTHNPAMDSLPQKERRESKDLLQKECRNLLLEVDRLKMNRKIQNNRLKNVMGLAFSSVNADDSKHMKKLSERSLEDSAVMKQISYLTMIFLPASFAAAIFGMNVVEITPQTNTSLKTYFATAISLTVVTVWVMMAWQGKWRAPSGEEKLILLTQVSRPNWTTWWRRLWK
ncbi:hypothetical protein BU17DRAFT_81731 [Hysterangium stoloniferum]|nr:hypothetical protein BU17DRAFT_81731 [Hysterangium stoloniferum]